jgi:serine/threonine protein kinase
MVSDFGMARLVENVTMATVRQQVGVTTTNFSAMRWAAPETHNGEKRVQYSTATDAYAFGVCMWEAVNGGQLPYSDIASPVTAFDAVKERKLRLEFFDACPMEISQLALSCLSYAPQHRPRMEQVANSLSAYLQTLEQNPRLCSWARGPTPEVNADYGDEYAEADQYGTYGAPSQGPAVSEYQ